MATLEKGYELIDDFLTSNQLNIIKKQTETINFPASGGGIRNAEKKHSFIRSIATSKQLIAHAQKYLPGEPHLVRAILFNKTTQNNWLVPWHQDRTVTISKKFENDEWGPWTTKDGVIHVQPPVAVLNQMVTFRIHIDDTNYENGCLKVIPKSHELGVLDHDMIQSYVKNYDPIICDAKAGSALIMRPHILHSSSKAPAPSQRRVLHLEYSSFNLPSGVTWA